MTEKHRAAEEELTVFKEETNRVQQLLQQNHTTEVEQIRRTHAEELAGSVVRGHVDSGMEMVDMKEMLAAALTQRKEAEEELATLNQKYSSLAGFHKAEMERLELEIDEMKGQLEDAVDPDELMELKQRHLSEVNMLKIQHQKKLEEAEAKHAEKMNEMEQEVEDLYHKLEQTQVNNSSY